MFKKKLILSVLIILVVSAYSNLYVYAEDTVSMCDSSDIMPAYNAITSTSNGINISSDGYASYSGKTSATGYPVAVYIELKQYINGDWVTIEDGYKSGNNTVLLTQYRWVDSGYLYCVKSTHYAYDSYGNLLDYVEKYSNSKYY